MRKIAKLAFAFLMVLSGVQLTKAQKIEDFVSKYTDVNGKKFMQPLGDVFSANLNSGLYHTAFIKKNGFQLYFGFVGMYGPIASSAKTFEASAEDPNYTGTTTTSTIFGAPDGGVIENKETGLVYRFPGGFDIDYVPLAVPQLTIGSVMGTDLTVRMFTFNLGEDVGKLNLTGFGLRHSVSQYLPNSPVDIAVGYYYQSFKLGDIINSTNSLISAQASYKASVFTFYGGLGYEMSTFDLEYDTEESGRLAYSLEGSNKMRLTLGTTINLGAFTLNFDYNVAKQSVATVGMGFTIGRQKSKEVPAETTIEPVPTVE